MNKNVFLLFTLALLVSPVWGEDPQKAGSAAYDRGDYASAIKYFTIVISKHPNDANAYITRGDSYSLIGDQTHAIADLTKAIQIDPHNTNILIAYIDRGSAYESLGSFDKEIDDAHAALKVNPKSAEAYSNLACAYGGQKKWSLAIAANNKSLALSPNDPITLNEQAWLLATCPTATLRDGKRAITLSTKSCTLTQWKKPSFIDTLAAAYAETGDYDNAIKCQKKYIDMLTTSDRKADGKTRLVLYQSKQPYHQPDLVKK